MARKLRYSCSWLAYHVGEILELAHFEVEQEVELGDAEVGQREDQEEGSNEGGAENDEVVLHF